MKVESFQTLLAQVPSLTEGQLDELAQAVEKHRSKTKALHVLETAGGAPKSGHCDSEQVVKNGHSRGLPCYCCRACGETFNAPHGHAAGRASHQGALLRAARVPRPGHARAGGCRRAFRASSAALPARPPPSSAEVMRARGRPAAHPAASAAWPARCVRAPGRAG